MVCPVHQQAHTQVGFSPHLHGVNHACRTPLSTMPYISALLSTHPGCLQLLVLLLLLLLLQLLMLLQLPHPAPPRQLPATQKVHAMMMRHTQLGRIRSRSQKNTAGTRAFTLTGKSHVARQPAVCGSTTCVVLSRFTLRGIAAKTHMLHALQQKHICYTPCSKTTHATHLAAKTHMLHTLQPCPSATTPLASMWLNSCHS